MQIPLHSVYSVLSVVKRIFNPEVHRMHGVGLMRTSFPAQGGLGIKHVSPTDMQILLHSVYSVLSVVRRIFNHGVHRMHRVGLIRTRTASKAGFVSKAFPTDIQISLHSVYSVLSVVRRIFNHGMHRMHGVGLIRTRLDAQGGLGKMVQLLGEKMDELLDELNEVLVS